jgi:hypothetical protein
VNRKVYGMDDFTKIKRHKNKKTDKLTTKTTKVNSGVGSGFTNGVVNDDTRYTASTAYSSGASGVGTTVIALRSPAADRIFHVDLTANVVPEPSSAASPFLPLSDLSTTSSGTPRKKQIPSHPIG